MTTPLLRLVAAKSSPKSVDDPIAAVRESTLRVVEHSGTTGSVAIGDAALDSIAAEIATCLETQKSVKWNEDDLHFHSKDNVELQCRYIIVLDALNFCFWPCQDLEYEHWAGGLKAVAENTPEQFDPSFLATITEEELAAWMPLWKAEDGSSRIPLLAERTKSVQEVGDLLLSHSSSAVSLVRACGGSCSTLVRVLHERCSVFRDATVYDADALPVYFYKRAQILCGDLQGAFRTAGITDPDLQLDTQTLTAFADYRLPQLLRERGVFVYSNDLASKVDAKEEILAGSNFEVEIRAATVQVVERLSRSVGAIVGRTVHPFELDWWLWQTGEKLKDEIGPHHRTLSVFY